jgi:hypothetical protein
MSPASRPVPADASVTGGRSVRLTAGAGISVTNTAQARAVPAEITALHGPGQGAVRARRPPATALLHIRVVKRQYCEKCAVALCQHD